MFKRLKLLIRLQIYKFKMRYYDRRYKVSKNKSLELGKKFQKASTNFYYAREHIHPEETWEMRAEREFQKGNFS